MRDAFCQSLVSHAVREDFVFLTGDLGFMALEPLRAELGRRFFNAGVAEQNMVSVAAGMARNGLRPWVYSIAPFLYARAFEQIRNDVCMHRLPVVMVGNGGGYGYGVMGGTHHALEDYGALLALAGVKVFVPAFNSDLPTIVRFLFDSPGPRYLRLGRDDLPHQWGVPAYEGWRKLLSGLGGTLIAVGPLVGSLWQACVELDESVRPNLWCVCEMPWLELPLSLVADLHAAHTVCVAEEHVSQGSVGAMVALSLLQSGLCPRRFVHRYALGYPSGRFGSQRFHRRENGLDAGSILREFQANSGST